MAKRNLQHVGWLLAAVTLAASGSRDPRYLAEIAQWRAGYESGLKRDNGWLSLAGLFWLKEGENRLGSAPDSNVRLPEGAPPIAGVFVFHEGQTRLHSAIGVVLMVNGSPAVDGVLLHTDMDKKPDRITLGQLSMIVIRRGSRYGIRLWDNGSSARSTFHARWFPIHESYRISATFTAYSEPRMIPILNVLGDTEQNPSPGFATFELAGKKCRLEPLAEGGHLFFIIKDLSSGHDTYAAGRFLYAERPKDGKVILDFNQAINPPCAYTPYATCPLPPKQNHLPVAVLAGEMKPDHPAAEH